MKRVLVFGTFDNLHPGHLDFFKQAKNHGDYLIAVVARDATVNQVKGHFPRQNENQRLEAVKNCGLVDEIRLGNLDNYYDIIKQINPNIIALGYDQTSFTSGLPEYIKKENLKIKIVRLRSYFPKIYKSSLIKMVIR
jgi:FAD synthetase